MKTTLEIDDALYREVKALSAVTGRRMKDLVNEGAIADRMDCLECRVTIRSAARALHR